MSVKPSTTLTDARLKGTVPAPLPVPARWTICQVGPRWGVFQSWAGPVYWLRLFDTWASANEFVRNVAAKAARTH